MLKQISDNEIYLLIKHIKSVLWRVAKRLSYIEDAQCLKVKARPTGEFRKVNSVQQLCSGFCKIRFNANSSTTEARGSAVG